MNRRGILFFTLLLTSAMPLYGDQGISNGIHKEYYPNGKVKSEANYKNGKVEGILKEYYESGRLAFIQTVRNGKIRGLVKAYYENGKLKGEVNYVDSMQDGELKEYYENGKIKEEVTYIAGQIINIKKFDEQGNMTVDQSGKFGPGCVFYEEVES